MSKKKIVKKNLRPVGYSSGATLVVSRACRNRCGYCGFWKNDYSLFVPYNTIKLAKAAVKKGAKEILVFSGERPDRFHPVKNTLDLWGFPSFARYLYTLCELAFLEGLLPKLRVGYLSFSELSLLREVSVAIEVPLGATDRRFFKGGNPVHQYSPGKSLESVTEVLENAGRLKIPVSINYLIGVGEKVGERKTEALLIKNLHEKFGHIQEIIFNNFLPQPGTPLSRMKAAKTAEILNTIRTMKRILPPEIHFSASPWQNSNIIQMLKAGINDLGMVPVEMYDYLTSEKIPPMEPIRKKIGQNKFVITKRLPIFSRYIQMGWYSGKMGQLLDRYREEIKEVSY